MRLEEPDRSLRRGTVSAGEHLRWCRDRHAFRSFPKVTSPVVALSRREHVMSEIDALRMSSAMRSPIELAPGRVHEKKGQPPDLQSPRYPCPWRFQAGVEYQAI